MACLDVISIEHALADLNRFDDLLADAVDHPAESAFLAMAVRCQEIKLKCVLMRKGMHPMHRVKELEAEYHDCVADTYRAYTVLLEPGSQDELAEKVDAATAKAVSCRERACELVSKLAKTPFVVIVEGVHEGGIGTQPIE